MEIFISSYTRPNMIKYVLLQTFQVEITSLRFVKYNIKIS